MKPTSNGARNSHANNAIFLSSCFMAALVQLTHGLSGAGPSASECEQNGASGIHSSAIVRQCLHIQVCDFIDRRTKYPSNVPTPDAIHPAIKMYPNPSQSIELSPPAVIRLLGPSTKNPRTSGMSHHAMKRTMAQRDRTLAKNPRAASKKRTGIISKIISIRAIPPSNSAHWRRISGLELPTELDCRRPVQPTRSTKASHANQT